MPTIHEFLGVSRLWKYDGTNDQDVLDICVKDVIGIQSNEIELPYIVSNVDGVLTIRWDQTATDHLPNDVVVEPNRWFSPGASIYPYSLTQYIGIEDAQIGTDLIPLENFVQNP